MHVLPVGQSCCYLLLLTCTRLTLTLVVIRSYLMLPAPPT